MDYRIQRLKEDLTNAQQRNKKQRIQLANYKKVHERDLETIKKYKEVIDKIDKYINDYNVFEVFSFPLMKRWEEEQVKSSIDYEFKTSLIKDLKDILKEVE